MIRLVLVRHGQALDVTGRCVGSTDVPLSDAGAEAMRRLMRSPAEWAGLIPGGIPRVVSSDLRRASASAEKVAAVLGTTIERDARLRELHFGEWDGRLWSDIEHGDPVRLARWMESWTRVVPPGGESVEELRARATRWLGDALQPRGVDRGIVVVSHAGWIRAAICQLLGREVARMFEIPVDHARATVIDVGESGAVLVASNVERIDEISRAANA